MSNPAAVDIEGLGETLDHLRRRRPADRGALRSGHQDHEFVTAEARHRVLAAKDLLEPVRDLDQQTIAEGVTVAVIDRLEPVEIDEQHHHLAFLPSRMLEHACQTIEQERTVRQPGDEVEIRALPDLDRGQTAHCLSVAPERQQQATDDDDEHGAEHHAPVHRLSPRLADRSEHVVQRQPRDHDQTRGQAVPAEDPHLAIGQALRHVVALLLRALGHERALHAQALAVVTRPLQRAQQQLALAPEQGDRVVRPGVEALELCRPAFDRQGDRHHPVELPVTPDRTGDLDAPAAGQPSEHGLADHEEVLGGRGQLAEVVTITEIVRRSEPERGIAQVAGAVDDEDMQDEVGRQTLQGQLCLALDRIAPSVGDGADRLEREIEAVERRVDNRADRARLRPRLHPRTLQRHHLGIVGIRDQIVPAEREREQAHHEDGEPDRVERPLDGGRLYGGS